MSAKVLCFRWCVFRLATHTHSSLVRKSSEVCPSFGSSVKRGSGTMEPTRSALTRMSVVLPCRRTRPKQTETRNLNTDSESDHTPRWLRDVFRFRIQRAWTNIARRTRPTHSIRRRLEKKCKKHRIDKQTARRKIR